MARKPSHTDVDPATRSFESALRFLKQHPLFAPIMYEARIYRREPSVCPAEGWVVVTDAGSLHVHLTRSAEKEEWIYVLAHSLLHLGMGHFRPERRALQWNTACDLYVARFLLDLKLGRAPEELRERDLPSGTEDVIYDQLCRSGIPEHLRSLGTAGPKYLDMLIDEGWNKKWISPPDWKALFAVGLRQAVNSAVEVAAGHSEALTINSERKSPAQRARTWFLNSYPLLGAMVSAFDVIEDPEICSRENISIAAVNPSTKEIFINNRCWLDDEECRFVVAHEVLHVGLMHDARCAGRDPYLWNVACDFVINGWLVEMGVGRMPKPHGLWDPELKGLSAESVYDRIVRDLRKYRKLATLRGVGFGELLGPPDWRAHRGAQDLDDFYRRALAQGLEYHIAEGRGYIPAGLVEEIRALSQPPIPWDVQLAQWFDDYFMPLEKKRSFARPSRRQAATPNIPRPRYCLQAGATDGRTFGVVLDTSGSMDRVLLAKALGAIASYSMARDVPAARVVFCDAIAYDQGYLPTESIADRVKVKGRGGTILQPAIDLLEKAEDFPKDGPLLIITDGQCDRLQVRRDHAFLMPRGSRLPFTPAGPIFRVE